MLEIRLVELGVSMNNLFAKSNQKVESMVKQIITD